MKTAIPLDNDFSQVFGKKIQALRLSHCWSQEDLAERTGLSCLSIKRIENGNTLIKTSTLLKLQKALKLNIEINVKEKD